MKTKPQGKFFVLRLDIFGEEIPIFINLDKVGCYEAMKKAKLDVEYARVFLSQSKLFPTDDLQLLAHTINLPYGQAGKEATAIIFYSLPTYKNIGLKDIRNIVHEASHVAEVVLLRRGAEREDETRAYVMEYIVKEVLENL